MRLMLALVALVPAVFGALERLAIPDVELHDPVWRERSPGSEAKVENAAWTEFLGRYLTAGADGVNRLDYAGVTAEDRAGLRAYLDRLEAVDPRTLSGPAQLAYWINLYNAATVDIVLAHYPVETIREIEGGLFDTGPWGEEIVTVLGRKLSLNDIEHGIIRAVWNEPRIHYAVNCAAIGCPNLAPSAWEPDALEARFAAAERAFVNDPRGVRIEEGDLVLSKIWFWFREDFGETETEVLERLRRVATGRAAEALAGRTEVDRYDYDWALNEQR